jgi:FixJ family two-component response regulator
MSDKRTTIAIIDSDDLLQAQLQVLIGAAGLTASLFKSAEEYLNSHTSLLVNCTVLDVPLPGMSGLDLQFRLAKAKRETPLVFLTAQNDVRTSVRAMKAGAVDFLTKPFIDEELLDAVKRGVERDRSARLQRRTLDVLCGRLTSLSPRERETMALLSSGQGPKQIAARLGICTHTARVHSSRLMAKMGARSIADLVRMVDRLGIRVTGDALSSTQMPITGRPPRSADSIGSSDIGRRPRATGPHTRSDLSRHCR